MLARVIRDMLARRGLTQAATAATIGVPYGTLRGWLLEGRQPDNATMARMLTALDATADERRAAWAALLAVDPESLPEVVGVDGPLGAGV